MDPRTDHDNVNDQVMFQDRIESNDQGKINEKEPDQPDVSLCDLKKDNSVK